MQQAHSPWKRRRFLAASAVAGTGALAFGFPAIHIPKPKDKLGVALVGLGYYSTDLLAPSLQLTKHCYLAGVVTGTPSKAEAWMKKYGIPQKNVYNYDNFDTIADNPDIDVVYVVLPNSMHHEYVLRAAKAGKHVWCEKPMAVTAQECREMIKACSDNKVKLAIGYRMQHEPNTREIMRYGKEKTFGQVRLINVAAGYREGRAGHWKVQKSYGGGAMMDMGVYSLQGARYTAGEEPIAVTAQHFSYRPELFKDVDETTTFQLEFPSGAVASCQTSHGINMNYLYANADQGWFRLDPFSAYSGVKGMSSKGPIDLPAGNEQATQMDDDALAILQNKALIAPGEEGLRDMIIVEAIYKSAAKNGERILL